MIPWRWRVLVWFVVVCGAVARAEAQQNPHAAYVFPAGGRQAAEFEVQVGGQYLDGVSGVRFCGEGVTATVLEYNKPLTPQQINALRQKLQEARRRVQTALRKDGNRAGAVAMFKKAAAELGVSEEELAAIQELRKKAADPKRQPNPQLAETVTLRVTVAADAEPGERQLRLIAASGLTNPLRFHVGPWEEYRESEPNQAVPNDVTEQSLPIVLNGQITPGDVDRFRIQARQGERLVVAAGARALLPYLADAVPGWFQATLTLYDANNKEVAYADDHRFHPDPVLSYEVPADGSYVLEIKDAVYRGREDFVYRISVGQRPFVTSVFPLGIRSGEAGKLQLQGWNLKEETHLFKATAQEPGIHALALPAEQPVANRVLFAVDTLPECLEREPNDAPARAQEVEGALIVNGRIDRPGDWDVFQFDGRAGQKIVAEVQARRLNSPLDSVLELTDHTGKQLAVNDDAEDPGAGLTTHHADSKLSVTLPAAGAYYLRLGDTQNQGGAEFAYRLRISPPRPDFELRVVPASINAHPGTSVPLTLYALRKDGFAGDIALRLKDAPPGFVLSGAWVPGPLDEVRLTLTVPSSLGAEPVSLQLEGRAVVRGEEVCRPAVPAEDMMQAFIYHHLVPAEELLVAARGTRRVRRSVRLLVTKPVQIPAGGAAPARFSVPVGPLVDQIKLSLDDPPPGIAIDKVSRDGGDLLVWLRADVPKAESGSKGNLIIQAFLERSFRRPDGRPPGPKRRIPVGFLPAVPYEVVVADSSADRAG